MVPDFVLGVPGVAFPAAAAGALVAAGLAVAAAPAPALVAAGAGWLGLLEPADEQACSTPAVVTRPVTIRKRRRESARTEFSGSMGTGSSVLINYAPPRPSWVTAPLRHRVVGVEPAVVVDGPSSHCRP